MKFFHNRRGFVPLLALLIVTLVLALGGGVYVAERHKAAQVPDIIFCTQEAKQCPDGSYVGRTGTNCEFAACPVVPATTSTNETANWKTYRNEQHGFEIKYPERLVLHADQPEINRISFFDPNNASDAPVGGYIYIKDNINEKTLDDLTATDKENPLFHSFAVITIGGEPAHVFTSGEFAGTFATVIHKDKIFTLTNELASDPQILSTFKFIEPTAQVGTGMLSGRVTIGPICPVEREGMPCPVPPEAYAAREFLVMTPDQSKAVKSFYANASGAYSVSLQPGTYVVVSALTGISYMSKDLPATVTIKAGQTTNLDIDVDTGIR